MLLLIVIVKFPQDHFCRSQVFFLLIALPAADDHISPGASAAPRKRYDMIQRQLVSRKSFAAVVTYPFSEKLLKIGGFPQLPGFLTFPFDMGIVFIYLYPLIHWQRHFHQVPGGSP